MAIKINYNGSTIIRPGAYSTLKTDLLTEAPLGESGVIGIVGSAVGGVPRVATVLQGQQIQAAIATYKSGPIADALSLLTNPSSDPDVPSGASKVIVYKTNLSTQATKVLSNDKTTLDSLLTLTSENYGLDENNLNVIVEEGSTEDANAQISSVPGAASYDLTGPKLLTVEIDGVTMTYTPLAGDFAGGLIAALPAEVVISLNTDARWAVDRPILASSVGNVITIEILDDEVAFDANQQEYGVMTVGGTAMAELDFTAGPFRGSRGTRVITVNKATITEASVEAGSDDLFSILYTGAGTACVMEVQITAGEKILATTCAGAGADDLSINLEDPALTVDELVGQITAAGNYTISSSYFNKESDSASIIDFYTAIDIKSLALVTKRMVTEIVDDINDKFTLVTAAATDDAVGQFEAVATAEYFASGANGDSSNTNFQSGFDALKNFRINMVVPLISADGAGSDTFTVDSVNAQADAHCSLMASITGKSERNAYVSKTATKTALITAAKALNSRHTSIVGQAITVLNSLGALEAMPAYALSCVLAGMQAGTPVGEPLTHKFIRANNVTQDASWTPDIDGEEMILAGITFVEAVDAGGYRVAIHNTTYSQDSNVIFNRVHINEAANYVAYELRTYLEGLFTGTKARTGTAGAIKNACIARLEQLRDEDIIVDGNETDGTLIPAYRNITVIISGTTASIEVTCTPVTGIDFVLSDIYLSNLTASASA